MLERDPQRQIQLGDKLRQIRESSGASWSDLHKATHGRVGISTLRELCDGKMRQRRRATLDEVEDLWLHRERRLGIAPGEVLCKHDLEGDGEFVAKALLDYYWHQWAIESGGHAEDIITEILSISLAPEGVQDYLIRARFGVGRMAYDLRAMYAARSRRVQERLANRDMTCRIICLRQPTFCLLSDLPEQLRESFHVHLQNLLLDGAIELRVLDCDLGTLPSDEASMFSMALTREGNAPGFAAADQLPAQRRRRQALVERAHGEGYLMRRDYFNDQWLRKDAVIIHPATVDELFSGP